MANSSQRATTNDNERPRVYAFVSALALSASICIYCASFWGRFVDATFALLAPFLVGALVLNFQIYTRERPTLGGLSFYWNITNGMPSWVFRCQLILVITALAHAIWFAVHAGSGVPAVVDGQYVINDHGRILKILTRADYLSLMGAGLRASMAIVAALYFQPCVYWWFLAKVENQNNI